MSRAKGNSLKIVNRVISVVIELLGKVQGSPDKMTADPEERSGK